MTNDDWFNNYNFLDFGCSDGSFIDFIQKINPEIIGCGLDISEKKVAAANARGFSAITFNILDLPDKKITDFVTMSHFLEHLESVSEAQKIITKAINISRKFVFVRQPWFYSDDILMTLKLKFYWSDWKGHRNHMGAFDFYKIFLRFLEKGEIKNFRIFGRNPIVSSSDVHILPLNAPSDQQKYNPLIHGPKSLGINFPFMIFGEIIVLANIELSDYEIDLCSALGSLTCLYDSSSQ